MAASVLIAGAGYVGLPLAKRLTEEGYQVTVLSRSGGHAIPHCSEVKADLGDPSSLQNLGSYDFIFFTAGADEYDEESYRRIYLEGLQNLLVATQPQHLFLSSSTGVYHQDDGSWVDEESPTQPQSFSGKVILEAEHFLRDSGLPGTIVRFGGIYGPGRTRLLQKIIERRIGDPGDDNGFTNRIHRDDCVGIFMHLLRLPRPKRIYLAVDSEPVDRRTLYQWLAEQLEVELARDRRSEPESRQVTSKRCTNSRLIESGYRFAYPDYQAGYADIVREVI